MMHPMTSAPPRMTLTRRTRWRAAIAGALACTVVAIGLTPQAVAGGTLLLIVLRVLLAVPLQAAMTLLNGGPTGQSLVSGALDEVAGLPSFIAFLCTMLGYLVAAIGMVASVLILRASAVQRPVAVAMAGYGFWAAAQLVVIGGSVLLLPVAMLLLEASPTAWPMIGPLREMREVGGMVVALPLAMVVTAPVVGGLCWWLASHVLRPRLTPLAP